MRVDYNLIKKAICRSASQITRGLLPFKVDLEKLNPSIADLQLVALPNFYVSEPVTRREIPFMSEYFKDQKLKWFNRSRQYCVLTFVPVDRIDDELERKIGILKRSNEVSDPDVDPVDIMADIIADYPCYNATVVGYQSNDPNFIGRNSYSIVIRANKNVITDPEYQYNNEDI